MKIGHDREAGRKIQQAMPHHHFCPGHASVWTLQSNACPLLGPLVQHSMQVFIGSPLFVPVRRLRLVFLLPPSLGACPFFEDAAAGPSLSLLVEALEAAGLAILALRCFFTPGGTKHWNH